MKKSFATNGLGAPNKRKLIQKLMNYQITKIQEIFKQAKTRILFNYGLP